MRNYEKGRIGEGEEGRRGEMDLWNTVRTAQNSVVKKEH
jgi:hypothetical protein